MEAVHPGDDQQRLIGGRYRLSAQLGSGAMGTVWSGYDEVLRRRVAVKELKVPPGVPQREALAMRERMLREARALGGLSHPNVITVYDVVDVDGQPMVVLEMLPSRNLAALITEQGRLSTEQAAVVGFATSAALRAAHRAGITHRDVKPANVLVAHDGQVKLTDFGIARNIADAPMTTAGLVLGSPAYIAPEVAAGQPVTPAADLWGLGATLFAAVEGRPPYDVRGNPVSTITEVVDGEVPRPSKSGPVCDVIAALMVKVPTQRMSLGEVRRRLRPLIGDPDDPLYPGSADAPTLAAAYDLESIPKRGATSGGWRTGATPPTGSSPSPLAPSPGPLPDVRDVERSRPVPATPSNPAPPLAGPEPATVLHAPASPSDGPATTWVASAGLLVAGAAVVLAGLTGGWAVTRAVAGQSPFTTVTVATASMVLRPHTDELGFTAQVPQEWTERRGDGAVSFVSPDGSEELTVSRVRSVDDVTAGLANAQVGPPQPVPGSEATQVVFRTTEGERHRTGWLRFVPAGDGVLAVRLTAPGGSSENVTAELFEIVAGRISPAG